MKTSTSTRAIIALLLSFYAMTSDMASAVDITQPEYGMLPPAETRLLAQAPAKGTFAVVNISNQTVKVFKDSSSVPIFESVCGTGAGNKEENATLVGIHKVLEKDADYKQHKAPHLPMPNAIKFHNSGIFFHGSDRMRFFANDPTEGMPQSGGCVRLPMKKSKELFAILNNGDTVIVVGSIGDWVNNHLEISALFDDSNGQYRMRVTMPNHSPKDVSHALQMMQQRKLYILRPNKTTDSNKCLVGYPFMPISSYVKLSDFNRAVLSPEAIKAGVGLKFDH